MSSAITALYQNRNHAQSAMDTLIAAGIPKGRVRLVVCPPVVETEPNGPGEMVPDTEALRELLREVGLPGEAWDAYCAKLGVDGAMLTILVQEAEAERVMGILQDHGSVDVDQRVATWRAEGWGGTSPVSTEGWGGYSATSTGGTEITASED